MDNLKAGHMAKILIVGSLNMDLVVRVPHSPMPGESVLGGEFETFPGGKGANQAVAAARMGAEVTMIGRVGNDDFGDVLIQNLVADKIKTNYVIKETTAPTGIAMIAVSDNGENSIVVAPGANMQVSVDDVNKASDIFKEIDLLLIQLECPLEAVAEAIKFAKANHVKVVLNPAPAQVLPEWLLADIDVITPNENELKFITGEKEISKGAYALLEQGVKNVLVTLGSDGAYLVNETSDVHFPAHKVIAVDTTAAGDSFNGALAVLLAENETLLKAVRFAMAAGALATTRRGAQPSIPNRKEVEQFLSTEKINGS